MKSFFNLKKGIYSNNTSWDYAIIGINHDKGSRIKGVGSAPKKIRNLSSKVYIGKNRFLMGTKSNKMKGFYNHFNNEHILEGKSICDAGIVKLKEIDKVCKFIGGAFPIFIGGDHAISYSIVKQLNIKQQIDIIGFDAHEDSAELNDVCMNNNVFRWLKTIPCVEQIIHIGLRGYSRKEACGLELFTLMKKVSDDIQLPKTKGQCCYVTIDLDVLDITEFYSVNYPLIGGLNYRELKKWLIEVFSSYNVIGVDIVEYSPRKDLNNQCGLIVLDLVLFILELKDTNEYISETGDDLV